MGSQLTKDYDIEPNPFGYCGPHDLWRMYRARSKNTGEAVTVITCRKKEIASQTNNPNTTTHAMQLLERSALMLKKVNLPGVVRLMDGPRPADKEVTRSSKEVALVMEPVQGTLRDLARMDAQGVGGATGGVTRAVEMRVGLADLLHTVTSLHSHQHWTHLNINPSSVFVTADRKWKLGGFEFAYSLAPGTGLVNTVDYRHPSYSVKEFQGHRYLTPDLDFAAPEYVLRGHISPQSDIWSFGALAHWLLLNQPLVRCHGKLEAYRSCLGDDLPNPALEGPASITAFLSPLLQRDPARRPKTRDLKDVELLHRDRRVVAVRGLDALSSMSMRERTDVLHAVEEAAHKLPPDLITARVVPTLQRYVKEARMMPHVLPPMLTIGELMSNEEFGQKIFPWVTKGMRRLEPPKMPQTILKYLDSVIMAKISASDVQRYVVPFLARCIDSSFHEIQTASLQVIQHCMKAEKRRLSFADFRKDLLPVILHNAQHAQVHVRIAALTTLGIVAPLLDRTDITAVIQRALIPALSPAPAASSAEPSSSLSDELHPDLVMTAVGVFNTIAKNAHRGFIARTILPAIVPLTAEDALSSKQFSLVMKAVRGMLAQIETDRQVDRHPYAPSSSSSSSSSSAPSPSPSPSMNTHPSRSSSTSVESSSSPSHRSKNIPHQSTKRPQQHRHPSSAPIPPRPRKSTPTPPVAPKKPPPVSETGNLLFADEEDLRPSHTPRAKAPVSSAPEHRSHRPSTSTDTQNNTSKTNNNNNNNTASATDGTSGMEGMFDDNDMFAVHRNAASPSRHQGEEDTLDRREGDEDNDEVIEKEPEPEQPASSHESTDGDTQEDQPDQEGSADIEPREEIEGEIEQEQEEDQTPKLDPRFEAILSGNFSWNKQNNNNDNNDNNNNYDDNEQYRYNNDHDRDDNYYNRRYDYGDNISDNNDPMASRHGHGSWGSSSNTDFDSLMSRFLTSKDTSTSDSGTVSWPARTNRDTGREGDEDDNTDIDNESENVTSHYDWNNNNNNNENNTPEDNNDDRDQHNDNYEDPWSNRTSWSSSIRQRQNSSKDIDFDKTLGLFLNSRNS